MKLCGIQSHHWSSPFFFFPFFYDGTIEEGHASLSGSICYSNFMAGQIIKKECHSVGCWQHFSLQPCVSIRSPGLSRGLFLLLFSISVFYLDLKWSLLNILLLPFDSPFRKWEMLCHMRFHMRDLSSRGRRWRSVQGGITIFSQCSVLKMQRREQGWEPARNNRPLLFKVIGQRLFFFKKCVLLYLLQGWTHSQNCCCRSTTINPLCGSFWGFL